MTEKNSEKSEDLRPQVPAKPADGELDAAGKSLSEALRISFIILKVIMIVLVIAFLASGIETVDSEEQALVLRFGEVQGEGEERLLGPGPHWILPYPINEIVKIPVEAKVNLPINSFWYFQTEQEMLSEQKRPVSMDKPLKPTIDGYCITRSEKRGEVATAADARGDSLIRAEYKIVYKDGRLSAELEDVSVAGDQEQALAGSDGSDYNIVHTKWQLTYQIDDPESFFRNVYVEDVGAGEVYFDVVNRSITPLLQNLFEGAVVTVMVHYTIDEAISSLKRIPNHVRALLQDKLDKIESGIKVVSVQLTKSECPRQVKIAFEASTMASQTSEGEITSARTGAETTINTTAGPAAYDLLRDKTSVAELSEAEQERLLDQLAGTAHDQIAQAQIYQMSVVEKAKAEADYLESLLPEYRQRPELVLQRIYLDAIEHILANADEKFVVQTAKDAKNKEIWVRLNRDPLLKPKTYKTQTTEEGQ